MNETNAIRDLAAASAIPATEKATKDEAYVIVPDGYKLEDLEPFHEHPRRVQQRVQCATIEALLAYTLRFGSESYMIFADPDRLAVDVVLDYHDSGELALPEANWCNHHAICTLPETTAWSNWTRGNNRKMSQTEFAEFIEDNAGEIVKPSATEMLEVARNLQAQRKVEFASRVDVANGDIQFTYETETHTKGNIHVPERFTVGLAPFQGAPAYEVEARLRYRISGEGELTMWYSLLRPDVVREDAFGDVVSLIQEATDPARVILGKC